MTMSRGRHARARDMFCRHTPTDTRRQKNANIAYEQTAGHARQSTQHDTRTEGI